MLARLLCVIQLPVESPRRGSLTGQLLSFEAAAKISREQPLTRQLAGTTIVAVVVSSHRWGRNQPFDG